MQSTQCLVVNTDDRVVVTAGLDNIAVITTEDAVMVINMATTRRDADDDAGSVCAIACRRQGEVAVSDGSAD